MMEHHTTGVCVEWDLKHHARHTLSRGSSSECKSEDNIPIVEYILPYYRVEYLLSYICMYIHSSYTVVFILYRCRYRYR